MKITLVALAAGLATLHCPHGHGTLAAAFGLVAPVSAQTQTAPAAPVHVAGTWELAADTAHGDTTLTLVLAQERDALTGTLGTPHGELPVEGVVKGRELRLHGVAEEPALTLVITLAPDGTASGSLTSVMGDATFTAKRIKSRH